MGLIIWLAAEGAWDDDVSQSTVVQCNEGLLKMIDEKVPTLIENCCTNNLISEYFT